VSDNAAVRDYWNQHIHDLDISTHQPGTREFFDDLDQYHFEKLHHLPRLIDFNAWRGKRVLDVGCGAGTDLARFAKGGAIVSGVDISPSAVALAKQNWQLVLLGRTKAALEETVPRQRCSRRHPASTSSRVPSSSGAGARPRRTNSA